MKDLLWNSKKSIILTKLCILALMVISIIMMFCGRYLISRFLSITGGAKITISKELSLYIITFISYGCLSAGLLLIIVTVVYHKLYLIFSLAALFMMLIVRVIKNAFEQAVKMKEELDLTI